MFPHKVIFYRYSFLHDPKKQSAKRASPRRVRSHCRAGSITVEAAMTIPFFFLAVVCLIYMMEIMAVRTSIRCGMQYAGKQAAEKTYANKIMISGQIEKAVVEAVGAERLNRSAVEGGAEGIDCGRSRFSAVSDILELHADYKIRLPIPSFRNISVKMSESMKFKGWSGYEEEGFGDGKQEMVYVTETGVVYHRKRNCPYLDLTIRTETADRVKDLRNQDHGRYYPCERCADSRRTPWVYVTDYGDRYHCSLACSGLKRTIYTIPLSEAAGKGACAKCGGRE